MTRDDWVGLGTSVGVHLALLFSFALLTTGRPETPTLGSVQVEIGAFAEGRPVRQADAPEDAQASAPEATDAEETAPAQVSETPPSAEEQQDTPVNLPDQEAPTGDDPPPEEVPTDEEPVPETPPATPPADNEDPAAEESAAQDASPEESETGGAETEQASGAAEGAEGSENDAEEAAPFDIEGLDRTRLYGSVPQYTEKVNATIKVEITVSPRGRVVGQRLLQKANPSLERSVTQALERWRFDRLPAGAPQKNQVGVVTFRFRLE